eukprot:scaffold2478_cov270-Pinguiococcus_pyrenoidosus.AAC.8
MHNFKNFGRSRRPTAAKHNGGHLRWQPSPLKSQILRIAKKDSSVANGPEVQLDDVVIHEEAVRLGQEEQVVAGDHVVDPSDAELSPPAEAQHTVSRDCAAVVRPRRPGGQEAFAAATPRRAHLLEHLDGLEPLRQGVSVLRRFRQSTTQRPQSSSQTARALRGGDQLTRGVPSVGEEARGDGVATSPIARQHLRPQNGAEAKDGGLRALELLPLQPRLQRSRPLRQELCAGEDLGPHKARAELSCLLLERRRLVPAEDQAGAVGIGQPDAQAPRAPLGLCPFSCSVHVILGPPVAQRRPIGKATGAAKAARALLRRNIPADRTLLLENLGAARQAGVSGQLEQLLGRRKHQKVVARQPLIPVNCQAEPRAYKDCCQAHFGPSTPAATAVGVGTIAGISNLSGL